MSVTRERRLLESILGKSRVVVADLTAALAVNDSLPLRTLRGSALVMVQDAAAAVRRHEEMYDTEKTPVATSASQAFRAVEAELARGRET